MAFHRLRYALDLRLRKLLLPPMLAATVSALWAHIIERLHLSLHYFKRFRVIIFLCGKMLFNVPRTVTTTTIHLYSLYAILSTFQLAIIPSIAACSGRRLHAVSTGHAQSATTRKMQNKQIVASYVYRLRGDGKHLPIDRNSQQLLSSSSITIPIQHTLQNRW